MSKLIRVAVLGSTGYVGLELVKILNKHPNVKIEFLGCENLVFLNINQLDKKIENTKLPTLSLNKSIDVEKIDLVFLCLPHGASHNYVKRLYSKVKIIDLSADFRLDSNEMYLKNYQSNHSCPELLNKFVYGLPEINFDKINKNFEIAVPGCYPTSILTPLIPLLNKQLLETDNIIIDSKSGYSGAGKKFDINNIKNKNDLNFYNYNTNEHRHICEIQQELNKNSLDQVNFSFNPHLLPSFRGMISTIYCDLKPNIKPSDINETLVNFSRNMKFVNIVDNDYKIDLFSIQNNNHCMIKIEKHLSESKIIIVSAIDNLLKGAAGQAVQCFNLIYNFDQSLSLN